ncbi:ABC-2 type transport system permease protein [Agrococcus baldri]|uniref:Transport permease protein n=1 Tax=Agrococcus baldri TaxID=153730 RepID=A0AA94KZW2_9MICO|nr:ABC transporter permease [Agrococcus baldri]SFS14519.1 ABC-2 type transport system permease protein [Agrococcus baldri]
MSTATLHTPRQPAHEQSPAARTAGSSPLASSGIFIGRSLLHSVRDGEGLIMAIALPVILMLLFTTVFGGAIQGDGGYIDYVVPGIILICAGFGAASTAVSVSRDMTAGAMLRYRTMPIIAATAIVGHVVASVVRNLIATAIVIGVGLLIGFRPTADALGWLGALGIVTLWILAVTAVFALIGLVAGSPEAANGYGFLILFLPYVSSAFVPIATMPEWLHGVAQHQPVTPIIETIRGLLMGGETRALEAVLWCAGILLVAAVLAAWRFPRTRVR